MLKIQILKTHIFRFTLANVCVTYIAAAFDGYYTLTSLPGQLRLDQSTWDRLTASNDASSGPDPLAFSLSRWDHVAKAAYATATQKLSFMWGNSTQML